MKKSNQPNRRRSLRNTRQLARRHKRSRRPSWGNSGLRIESLEDRLLLATDLGLAVDPTDDPAVTVQVPVAAASDLGAAEGEGVEAVDLVAFAKALDAAGAKLYGSAWCVACTAQKELFEDGGQFLPFVEVTNADRTLNQVGIDEEIDTFPTWEFPDGTRETGSLSLETISQRSDVAIPTSADPYFAPIDDLDVYGGSPLHLALDGYDPNGGDLTFTVTSSDPDLISPTVLAGNRSARVTIESWGDMVFELFEGRVPEATGRFIELAQAGFYDADTHDSPITIHRVIDNFVLQFGDPTGTGAGGSSLGDFDDDFHPDLQHNNPGGISWAKAGDDTNDSQIFVIDVPTRFLDYNHSYFGQLTEGDSVRDAITATATNSSDQPLVPINIEQVEIFEDNENAVVMLKAAEDASGTADITVTIEDSDGNQYSQTFEVTVSADPYNSGPYLEDIPDYEMIADTTLNFQLAATDVEGDAVTFSGVQSGTVGYSFNVDSETGDVSITPPSGFVGTMELLVRVRPETSSNTSDTYDSQLVSIVVKPDVPGDIDLVSTSDTGSSDSDNITSATDLVFEIPDVIDGSVVQLMLGTTSLGQTTVDGTTASLTISGLTGMGDGDYELTATQTYNGVQSDATDPFTITIDTTPPGEFTSTPPTNLNVGQPLVYDVQNPGEGTAGFSYSLVNAPAGVSIDATNGEMNWTPLSSDVGVHSFTVVATDLAGNTREQDLNITVATDAVISFRLETTDQDNNVISNVEVGDEFLLNVYVADLRDEPFGVFSAFLDILYDSQLIQVDGAVTFGSSYPNFSSSDTSTAGLIDETGAIASFNELGGGEFLLFSVPLQAKAAGEAGFVGEAADDVQASELLLFGEDGSIDTEDVIYGTTVLTVNPAFDAVDDEMSVDEDSTGVTLDVLDNDEIRDGSPGVLTITEVGINGDGGVTSQGGTVEIVSGGTEVLYIPAADFSGTDTFEYSVSDGTGSKTAVVTLNVGAINDPPTALDDEFTVGEDASEFGLNVLNNDTTDPDTDETLTITAVDQGSEGGVVTIASDGSRLLYTPPENFFGSETFYYTISDGNGGTDQAEVFITVTEVNDPPVATADTIVLDEDSTDNVIDVLANDDTAGDVNETLSIINIGVPDQGGTASIAGDGLSITYTPAADFFGIERFSYTISDGNGGTAETIVTVSVEGSNDPPTAVDDDAQVTKNTTANRIDVLDNDSSAPDGDEVLVVTAVGSSAQGGQVAVSADGTAIEYTPPADFTGTDTVTYTIEDPDGATDTATVTVEVLDYIPSDLSGYVFFDVNNDGVKDAVEVPIGGVTISLQGTDILGATVQLSTETNAHGYYVFEDLVPGSYTIIEQQPNGVLDGVDSVGSEGGTAGDDQLTIELDQDVVATDYNFGERGREAQHITLYDFLASTPRESVISSTGSEDNANWYAIQGGWSHAQSLDIQDTDDASVVELQVTDEDAQQFSTMLYLDNASYVQHVQYSASARMMRIVAAPQLLFPDADCACGDEAEGELATVVASSDDAEGEPATAWGFDPLAVVSASTALSGNTIAAEADLLGWVADTAEGEPLNVAVAVSDTDVLDADASQSLSATDQLFASVGQLQSDDLIDDESWSDMLDKDDRYAIAVDQLMEDLDPELIPNTV